MAVIDICCIECFAIIQCEDPIPPTGLTVKCFQCDSAFSVYPSRTVIGDFLGYVAENFDISVRAFSVIRQNARNVSDFLSLSRTDFLGFRNCGLITANELIQFQLQLRKKLGYGAEPDRAEDKPNEANRMAVIEFLSRDGFFGQLFESELSASRFKPLRQRGFDTLEKLLALSYENALQIKWVGRKTVHLIRELQVRYNAVVKIIADSEALRFMDFGWVVRSDQTIRDILSCGNIIDVNDPFPSISRWIFENSGHSERNKDVFMCRMGMLGGPPMTYEEIGVRHGISRERARQIVEKVKSSGRRPLQRIRLAPLIAEEIATAERGLENEAISELTETLSNRGPKGVLLKNSDRFIEYLRSFPEWRKTGE